MMAAALVAAAAVAIGMAVHVDPGQPGTAPQIEAIPPATGDFTATSATVGDPGVSPSDAIPIDEYYDGGDRPPGDDLGGGSRLSGADNCPATDLGTLTGSGSTTDAVGTCGRMNNFENDGDPCSLYGGLGADVIYQFQVATAGLWTFDVCGATWDTSLMLREETGGGCPGDWLACNGDSCGYQSRVFADLVPGITYYLIVDGYSGGYCGPFTLNWTVYTGPPANDDCDDVTPVALFAGVPLTFNGDNTGATLDCPSLSFPEVWHAFTTSETLDVYIDMCDTSAGWGHVYTVLFADCPCATLIRRTDYGWVCPNGNFVMYYAHLPPGTYYLPILTDASWGAQGPYTVNVIGVPSCTITCPAGSVPEGEACGEDRNGGCNMASPEFEPITCGEVVCGTVWANNNARDTDWYEVVTTEDTIFTWQAEAEFPIVIGLAPTDPCGSGNCDDLGDHLNPYVAGGTCDLISVTTGCLPPGKYWLFVSSQLYDGWTCGDYNDYYAMLTCTPCTLPRGACCLGDGTCEVLAACQCTGVYAGDGTTCDPNPCPLNDSCEDATPIGEVIDLPFDTSLAMFDGLGTCMSGPNLWYCYTPACTGLATISLCGSSYDTKLAVYEGCSCDALGPQLGCNDDFCGPQSELTIPVFPAQEYLIEVGGHGTAHGPGILNVACTPASGSLVVEAPNCQFDVYPAETGHQVVVQLWMRNLTHAATGFQAFLQFNQAVLAYRGDLSSYTVDPFTEHLTAAAGALVGPGQLNLDGSVDDLHNDGTADDKLLATLVFDVLQECDAAAIEFRMHEIFYSELSYRGYLIGTTLVGTSFWSDHTPPTINGLVVTGGQVDADCECTVSFAATVNDNCCLATADIDVTVSLTTGNATLGTPTISKVLEADGKTVTVTGSVLVSSLTGCPATVKVEVDARDCCGNPVTPTHAEASGDVHDTIAPVVTAGNVTQNADAGVCTALVTLTASATDNCDTIPAGEISFVIDLDQNGIFGGGTDVTLSGSPATYTFDTGAWAVRAEATDDCLNTGYGHFTVTVEAFNEVQGVVVQLQGVNAAQWPTPPLTRCIKFVARNATTGECAPAVHVPVTFTGVPATGTAAFEIECGEWDELCAKDEQHTLYDTVPLSTAGTQYTTTANLYLLAGDTDNDSDVDIHDITWLMYQWGLGSTPAPPAGCPWDGTRDGDFSNDYFLDTTDYLLLSNNWHEWATCTCGTLLGGGHQVDVAGRQVSMLVAELPPEMADSVDLNRDGVVDFRDVREFEVRSGLPDTLSTLMEASTSPAAPAETRRRP
jgi:hypothetical protein